MKLTKEDYMRLPKERLAELLVEMQNELPSSVPVPTLPSITPQPWEPPYRFTSGGDSISRWEVKAEG